MEIYVLVIYLKFIWYICEEVVIFVDDIERLFIIFKV